MRGFNLSALAVRERAITLFFICASALAGIYAYFQLGRAEDPSFTIKVLTVTAVWPGATAQEMQDLVAEPLEKRLQELRWYDRVETITRPGLALMTLQLRDKTPPKEVAEQFYQARKKLGDEARKLPQGAIGPFVNDEYSDVSFALYSVEAAQTHPGGRRTPPEISPRSGSQESGCGGRTAGAHLRRVFLSTAHDAGHLASGHLCRSGATECGDARRLG
jgi:multidrug efflux pump subunit AcrB